MIQQRNQEAERGVMVLVFVHGWKNNADLTREAGNAAKFRDGLIDLARQQRQEGAPQPDHIVGVFLGWRGATTRVPFVEQLTFWDRRIAADRMSSHAMRETLFRLAETTKDRPTSKFLLMGHSMGGQIVGDSLSDAITSLLLPDSAEGVPVLADLVVLVNPARDGLAAKQFVDFLKRRDASVITRDAQGVVHEARGPLRVSITSEADGATRTAYSAGRSVANALGAFQPAADENNPGQRYLVTHAEGHIDTLLSHRAYLVENELVLEKIPDSYNDTPYWIVRVTPEICADHSDLSNPNLSRLLDRLYELNGAYDVGVRPYILTNTQSPTPATGTTAP